MSDSNDNSIIDKKLSKPSKKRSLSTPDDSEFVEKKSKIDDFPMVSPSLVLRASSIGATQATLSQPVDFNNNGKYEMLRALAIGATDENPEPEIKIAPVTEATVLGDFSNVITGDGKIFITATTQQSVTYNDLNVLVYQLEDNNVTKRKFLILLLLITDIMIWNGLNIQVMYYLMERLMMVKNMQYYNMVFIWMFQKTIM